MTRVGGEPQPAAREAFQRASAACGIASPILSGIVAGSVGYLNPGYSLAQQRLSELGIGPFRSMKRSYFPGCSRTPRSP